MTFSKQFQERMDKLNAEDIPRIIKGDLSSLANGLAPVIESIVMDIILANVNRWREGYITTIDNMIFEIERDLAEDKLADKLKNNDRYKTVVKNWTVEILGKDIALQLKDICEEYNVYELSLESLNVMTNNVSVYPETYIIEVDPLGDEKIVAIMEGFITSIILPSILIAIGLVVDLISSTLGVLIFSVLSAIGPIGWTVIKAVLGIEMFKLRIIGFEDFKQIFNKKVRRYELPLWVRDRVTNGDIKKKISASDIKSKIQAALLEEENKNKFVEFVSNVTMEQVKQRTNAIKFFIESR